MTIPIMAMTAIIMWAEDVTSLAEPPIVSECSVSGSAVGSGLLFPDSCISGPG